MKSWMKYSITFICGAILGGCATYKAIYKHFEEDSNKRIEEELRKAQLLWKPVPGTNSMENRKAVEDTIGEVDDDTNATTPDTKISEQSIQDRQSYARMAGHYQGREPFAYDKVSAIQRYKDKCSVDPAETESPSEDDDSESDMSIEIDDGILLIQPNIFYSVGGYEKKNYTLYDGGEDGKILVDDADGEVIYPEETCGEECFEYFSKYEPNKVFIRDVNNGVDYGITRVYGTYYEAG